MGDQWAKDEMRETKGLCQKELKVFFFHFFEATQTGTELKPVETGAI